MQITRHLFKTSSLGVVVCTGLFFSPLAFARGDDRSVLDTRKGGGQNIAGHAGLMVEQETSSGSVARTESDVRKGGGQDVAGHAGPMTKDDASRESGVAGSQREGEVGMAGAGSQAQREQDVVATVGQETSCGKTIIYKTEHAVGDPCMDSRSFMQTLGFNESQIENVLARVESVGTAIAH